MTNCDIFAGQVTAYCASALASGTLFYLWRRMGQQDRMRAWRLYGWYCGLMLCGSCFGAVAWASNMKVMEDVVIKDLFPTKGTSSPSSGDLSDRSRWFGIHLVTYSLEFLCLSAAGLLVLERLSDFAAPMGGVLRQRWAAAGRVAMAVVVMCNVAGIAASIAAAISQEKNVGALSKAESYAANNSTAKAIELKKVAENELNNYHYSHTVQQFCEVVVLMFIVAAFVVAGVLSVRRISVALRQVRQEKQFRANIWAFNKQSDPASPVLGEVELRARNLQLKTVATTAIVLAGFLLRSVLSFIYALTSVYGGEFKENECPGVESFCDASCPVHVIMLYWIMWTPEFRPTVVLISSPLVLLAVLWSMTSGHIWQRMKQGRLNVVPLLVIARDRNGGHNAEPRVT
jgi:hypothetical protein